MKVVGIVAEFNPLHNGHKYLIDSVRKELNPDAVVVVMSGNFVQRGMPAIQDKFTRANLTIEAGADLVFELPVCYSTCNASLFAKGAIAILKGLGCVTHIAFGSESGNMDLLTSAAELSAHETPEFKESISAFLSEGLSYPAAYEMAFRTLYPELSIDFIDSPNDVLAREYLKQNIIQDAGLVPFVIKRIGAGHNQPIMESDVFASGSALRQAILNGGSRLDVYVNIPDFAIDALDKSCLNRNNYNTYFNLVRYVIASKTEEEISNTLGVSEGLEYKLKTAIQNANSLDELIAAVKSKRHTYAKISRVLSHLVLGITNEAFKEIDSADLYGKLLAFNDVGQQVLNSIKKTASIPIISNVNKQSMDNEAINKAIKYDLFANDVYSIIANKNIYESSDHVNIPRKQG